MKIPALKGLIRRRLLVNFRAEPEVIAPILPKPFRPKLQAGQAIVGVCLIRLEQIRPAALPLAWGIFSENAAHRIAVEWEDEAGLTQQGVFIPRRDTNSWMNHLAGGRLFPGQHHLAAFRVHQQEDAIDFAMQSHDHQVEVRLAGKVSQNLPASSCFADLDEASAFFAGGCLGYSLRHDSPRLDGLWLRTQEWRVDALELEHVFASWYQRSKDFPRDSIHYDHTLLMRNIRHEWHAAEELIV
ncbi:MAG: DUF2071 domain-containing protein [Candidatus Sericytochromatia bacterium]